MDVHIFGMIGPPIYKLVALVSKGITQTLPEAQRTQGIDSIIKIIFLTEINLKVASLGSKFGHQMVQLVLVPILATRWCYLH